MKLFSDDLIQTLKQFQYGAFDEIIINTSDDESISNIDGEIMSTENET